MKSPLQKLRDERVKYTLCFLYVRVIARSEKISDINGQKFLNFGAHCDNYPCNYLTAAAAIGMTKKDVDLFIGRLDQVLKKCKKLNKQKKSDGEKHTTLTATLSIKDTMLEIKEEDKSIASSEVVTEYSADKILIRDDTTDKGFSEEQKSENSDSEANCDDAFLV